jgi:hypothetical protein
LRFRGAGRRSEAETLADQKGQRPVVSPASTAHRAVRVLLLELIIKKAELNPLPFFYLRERRRGTLSVFLQSYSEKVMTIQRYRKNIRDEGMGFKKETKNP